VEVSAGEETAFRLGSWRCHSGLLASEIDVLTDLATQFKVFGMHEHNANLVIGSGNNLS